MEKLILYPNKTGIAYIIPSNDIPIDEIANRIVPTSVKHRIIKNTDLPKDFRDAWEHDFDKNDGITINLDKAKDITKERLRIERKPLLEAEDIKFMQAQESDSDTKAIVTEKQRLRDITKQVDSCKTTDELKALNCEAS